MDVNAKTWIIAVHAACHAACVESFTEIRKQEAARRPANVAYLQQGPKPRLLCVSGNAALTRDSRGGYIGMNKPLITGMNPLELNLALGRLNAALDQLASSVERQAGRDAERPDDRALHQAAEDERQRLAAALAGQAERAALLEQANLAVEARLGKLGTALRGLAQGLSHDRD